MSAHGMFASPLYWPLRPWLAQLPPHPDARAVAALADQETYWQRFLSGGLFMQDDALGRVAEDYVRKLKVKTPHIHQETRLLSGGNQQKVVIAKWLLRDCDILIFDEPTRGIDVGSKAQIYELIAKLAGQGCAVVMVSSYLPELFGLCDRIAVMRRREVVACKPTAEWTEQTLMTAAVGADAA